MAKKTFQDTLDEIQKDRDVRIASLSDFDIGVESWSTGNLSIDFLTGIEGFPKGRIIELFGPPSSGKTTAALQAAAQVQKSGGRVVYADYENALDPEYCEALGVDAFSDQFLVTTPSSLEEGLGALHELIKTGEVQMCIVDSVAAMVTEDEVKADSIDNRMAAANKGRLMYAAVRSMLGDIQKHNVTFIFINHLSEKMATSFVEKRMVAQGATLKTTPGGKAVKFFSSVRIEFNPAKANKGKRFNPLTNEMEDTIDSTDVYVTVEKNKVGPPKRNAKVRVRFGHGFSQAFSVFTILLAYGLITKKGATYTFDKSLPRPGDDDVVIIGEDKALTAIESDPEWEAALVKVAHERIYSSDVLPVPADSEGDDESADDATVE